MSFLPPQGRANHPPRRYASHERAAALVIVLAFVVLLTGLMVAYFSRSVASRQLSNSSAGQTKAAMLARSASDIVISGFKQEIAAGSVPTPSPSLSYQYFVPAAPANAVPVRFGTPAPSGSPAVELIPNLVRRSVAGDIAGGTMPIPAPAVPSMASSVNSASDAAIGGRSVTLARWNSHYLIPRASTALDNDSTPDSTNVHFVAPDWVLMTRNGPTYEPAFGSGINSGSTAINNAVATNQNYVVGRYAYAIYDEGGLLDMNVAGHPTAASPGAPTTSVQPPPTPPTSVPFTAVQISQKNSLAMADLTQLPARTSANTNALLTQAVVDEIMGWRNYASSYSSGSGPSGTFPGFGNFTSSQAANWFGNFAFNNTSGFLSVYGGTSTSGGQTDQALLSRKQLLQLRSSINSTANPFPASVLQYMGTFSRSLEQPSYVPAHIQYPKNSSAGEAPNVNAVASSAPPSALTADSYLGNNDAAGSSGATSGQDLINPSLLFIRVTNSFHRFDAKQTLAVVGEPLLKRKFALSRLAEIRYDLTDSSGSLTDPNFIANPSNSTAKNHIKDWFGLSRTSASAPWTYNHGATTPHIMTLEEVAALPAANAREPDFAELLKAAINVGSLAKGGPNLHNNQGNYQYTLDSAGDYQVLQIMANLIDQSDTDSYPTVIQIAAGSVMRTFRGIEDLPYFYRYHQLTVVTQLPSPLLSNSNAINWHMGTPPPIVAAPSPQPAPPPTFKTTLGCKPGNPSDLTSGGKAVFLYVPDVWNPHDANTVLTYPSGTGVNNQRPSTFRLAVITDDPVGQTPAWTTGCLSRVNGDWYGDIPPTSSIPANLTALVDGTTSLIFNDNNGKLYREPTLIYRTDSPAGSSIAPDTNTSLAGVYTDANSNVGYVGVEIGQTPVSYVGTVDTTKYYGTYVTPTDNITQSTPASVNGSYIFQGSHLDQNQAVPTGGYAQYTFRLQYLDPNNSGNWITYDEKYPDFHGLGSPNMIVNQADWPNNQWKNIWSTKQMNDASSGYDPRTARFGIGTGDGLNSSSLPLLETDATTYFNSNTSAGYTSFAASKFTVAVSERPFSDRGNSVNYSNPGMTSDPGQNKQMRWFAGVGWSASNGQNASPDEYDGLFSQNNPNVNILARDNSTTTQIYYEDADGVARRAMGAYALTGMLPASNASVPPTSNLEGLPEATANTYASGTYGVGTPTAQNLSRPLILNRPFRNVGEMSYAFRGEPWKQIDFFTPESGDSALLDVFCVSEPPADATVAGKVNLNTHQAPVLQAIIAGAVRDELNNLVSPPSYSQSTTPLTTTEAANVAAKLVSITTDQTNSWRGPLSNVANLVSRYVGSSVATSNTATDYYTFNETVSSKQYTYAGLSAALDNSVYATASPTYYKVQRMRESAIRALAASGQTRVWNLMIDVVAQTGRYPSNATALPQFSVDGESRYWVHVAIDRYTGEVIDKQIEPVSE